MDKQHFHQKGNFGKPKSTKSLAMLPPPQEVFTKIDYDLLCEVRGQLGRLDGLCLGVNKFLLPHLIAPIMVKESVDSSKIENVETSLRTAFEGQIMPESEQSGGAKEVMGYRRALDWGISYIEKTNRFDEALVLGLNARLLGTPPQIRVSQNYIVGSRSGKLIYEPPSPTQVKHYLTNWFAYMNSLKGDPLIRASVGHYQFEAIHPFIDGNGRVGRILLLLSLVKDRILTFPVMFLSDYFFANRADYYEKLLAVTDWGEWNDFVEYVILGMGQVARDTGERLRLCQDLFEKYKSEGKKALGPAYEYEVIEAIFRYPIINPTKLASVANTHYTTASRNLDRMTRYGWLQREIAGKYKFYANIKLIDILKK